MKNYRVYGIGNALVDAEFIIDDSYLKSHGISKGTMSLITTERQLQLLESLPACRQRAGGGSAANTMIAVSQFGAKSFYSCRVANDATGMFFLHDLHKQGVTTSMLPDAIPYSGVTGSCLVFITKDAERSLNTCLGASEFLGCEDVVNEAIEDSEYVYIEGYLAAQPSATKAAVEVRRLAEHNNVKTTLSLSDYNMVRYCRSGLEAMIGDGVNHLFCNEEEVLDWDQGKSMDKATERLLGLCDTCSITCGDRGSRVYDGHKWLDIPPAVPKKVVDTTGAGDLYAGAFLYAFTQGYDLAKAGHLASLATAKLVSQFGPRLQSNQYAEIMDEFTAKN